MVRSFRFERYRGPSGLLRWRLLVGKQVVAVDGSTRAFSRRGACENAVNLVRLASDAPVIDLAR
jgi:uncharacterized protein YegP (UPF0339 family)